MSLTEKKSEKLKEAWIVPKAQERVAGREHLLLNHPPLDPLDSKGSKYIQIQQFQVTFNQNFVQCILYKSTPVYIVQKYIN